MQSREDRVRIARIGVHHRAITQSKFEHTDVVFISLNTIYAQEDDFYTTPFLVTLQVRIINHESIANMNF